MITRLGTKNPLGRGLNTIINDQRKVLLLVAWTVTLVVYFSSILNTSTIILAFAKFYVFVSHHLSFQNSPRLLTPKARRWIIHLSEVH